MAGEMETYSDALAQFKNMKSEIVTIVVTQPPPL